MLVVIQPTQFSRYISLMDKKYKVTHIQPVDMFPQTHHVENIIVLELK